MASTISDRVVEQLKVLPLNLQWRVLEFARALAMSEPKGTPGIELAHFAGTITPEDAELMRIAIKEEFESISPEEQLHDWAQVFAGLDDAEVEEILKLILSRHQK